MPCSSRPPLIFRSWTPTLGEALRSRPHPKWGPDDLKPQLSECPAVRGLTQNPRPPFPTISYTKKD